MEYVGRFAPSPTGPLHYGSLVAALASYLDARHANGAWLLRIEDLDPPRESASAPAEIIHQLSILQMKWDGDILFQSTRLSAYEDLLQSLIAKKVAYPCICTRKQVPGIYPGTCRRRPQQEITGPKAIRLCLPDHEISFDDRVFGQLSWRPKTEMGDFIIKRKDGLFAYQLAVVADDHFQNMTSIVRGSDLLDSTPRQLALIDALQYSRPTYLHIPVMVGEDGHKLSKQSHAKPLATDQPISVLRAALRELGQNTQDDCTTPGTLLTQAALSWQPERIPRKAEIPAPSNYL